MSRMVAVGDIFDLTTVSSAQVAQLNGRVQILDNDIQAFNFVPGPETTPDQYASAAAHIVSLRLRWQTWRHLQWDAWWMQHTKGWTRLSDSAAVEFSQKELEYNAFWDELVSLGGKPTAGRFSLEIPPDQKTGADKFIDFLNSTKWILAIGLVAYVLVETDALSVVRMAVRRKTTATSNYRRRRR